MTDEMLRAVLETAETELDADGDARLPEGRTLTLYGGHDGVALSIHRVQSLSLRGEVVMAEDRQGELFVIHLADLFAAAVSGGGVRPKARKAGFIR